MEITYRRTGGILTLVAVAATLLAVVVGGALLLVIGTAVAATVLIARAVLPSAWRTRRVSPEAPWPQETIEATAVKVTDTKARIE